MTYLLNPTSNSDAWSLTIVSTWPDDELISDFVIEKLDTGI